MRKKINLLQITANLGIGGLERVVVNLARNINKDRFNVSVCCLKFKGPFAEELEATGIKVHLIPQTVGPDYLAWLKLIKIIRSVKPQIVHTHNLNASIDGIIASTITGIPVKIHTDHARKFPDKLKYMTAERLLSVCIKKIVAVTNETKTNLIRYEKIPSDKITVINNGINGEEYDIHIDVDKKKQEMGLQGFKHVVGLGVRLTAQKGIIHLIHAAPAVLREFPHTAFIVAGKGGLLNSLKAEAAKTGVEKNFFFLGPRLDMPEILQILDLYVLPSEWEGLPLVLLEAMAARRAIIATDVGGNSMAIKHGQSGYLVPPKDPAALSNKIIELLSNDDLRAVLSKHAYLKFFSGFSVERMAADYEKIYQKELMKKGILISDQ